MALRVSGKSAWIGRAVSTGLLAACMLCGIAAGSAVQAQESLPEAIDRAGSAMNRALGNALGLPQQKPPRKRSKPAGTGAKPSSRAAAKPAERPAEKPAAATRPAPSPDPRQAGTPASVPLPPEPPEARPAGLAASQPPVAATADLPENPPVPSPFPKTRNGTKMPGPAAASHPEGGSARAAVAEVPEAPKRAEAVADPSASTAPRGAAAGTDKTAASDERRIALVPLPPPNPDRPALATPAALPPVEQAEPDPEPANPPAVAPTVAAGCAELTEASIAVFEVAEAPPSKGACGIERPVRLSAVRTTQGELVTMNPAPLLRCDMAVAIARWIREEVAPAVGTLGSPLEAVEVAAAYDCRPRNRVAGAKMSEHGRGNAMDTRGYRLKDGRAVRIGGTAKEAMSVAFQERLKASACGRFMTILGPGSDGYHEEHLHVDLQPRRSKMSLCRWAVRDMTAPKPVPKPASKPDAEPPSPPEKQAAPDEAPSRAGTEGSAAAP